MKEKKKISFMIRKVESAGIKDVRLVIGDEEVVYYGVSRKNYCNL